VVFVEKMFTEDVLDMTKTNKMIMKQIFIFWELNFVLTRYVFSYIWFPTLISVDCCSVLLSMCVFDYELDFR